MALTQEQWFRRLKSWVPGWFFESEKSNTALFYGIAKLLRMAEEDRDELFNQTMIDSSEAPYLDLHGSERSVARESGESNASYRPRIKAKSTKSQISKPSLESITSSIVTSGKSKLVEDWNGGIYCGREYFINRGDCVIDPVEDAFTIVVDQQADSTILDRVVSAIARAKAFGVVFRVVERYIAGFFLVAENADQLLTEDGFSIQTG